MGWIRSNAHRTTPLKLLIFGLILIGARAYTLNGSGAAEFAIKDSLAKLLIQVPAGIVATLIASRLIDFDFGTVGTIALKIAGITILAEGVECWISNPILAVLADLVVMLIGFFWLFELSTWQTYFLVFLNFAVLFGAHYLMDLQANSGKMNSVWPGQHVRGRHR